MSHTVTVTRTTTTTTTSAIIINSGYLKTWPGLLKLFQTLLGIVVVGLISYYYNQYNIHVSPTVETFYLLMSVTFLVGTFLLLFSCLISISTASIISKTIFELVYHFAAAIMYIAASLAFLVSINQRKRYGHEYEPYMAAGIIGLIISGLYIFSTIFAYRSYRGL